MKYISLFCLALLAPTASAHGKVPGWQLATTAERCLSFNTLGAGPPLQVGLLHQQGGPWITVIGTDATASMAEGTPIKVRFEYQNGFARREFAARTALLGRSMVVLLESPAGTFSQFDPADISPPQALLLVEEVGKPFTLTNVGTGAILASGKVPAGFGAAFTEFLACATALEASSAIPPR